MSNGTCSVRPIVLTEQADEWLKEAPVYRLEMRCLTVGKNVLKVALMAAAAAAFIAQVPARFAGLPRLNIYRATLGLLAAGTMVKADRWLSKKIERVEEKGNPREIAGAQLGDFFKAHNEQFKTYCTQKALTQEQLLVYRKEQQSELEKAGFRHQQASLFLVNMYGDDPDYLAVFKKTYNNDVDARNKQCVDETNFSRLFPKINGDNTPAALPAVVTRKNEQSLKQIEENSASEARSFAAIKMAAEVALATVAMAILLGQAPSQIAHLATPTNIKVIKIASACILLGAQIFKVNKWFVKYQLELQTDIKRRKAVINEIKDRFASLRPRLQEAAFTDKQRANYSALTIANCNIQL